MAEANFHWFKTQKNFSVLLSKKIYGPKRFSFTVILHRFARQLFVFSDRLQIGDRSFFRQKIRQSGIYLLKIFEHFGVLSRLFDQLGELNVQSVSFRFLFQLPSLDLHSALPNTFDDRFDLFEKILFAVTRRNRAKLSRGIPTSCQRCSTLTADNPDRSIREGWSLCSCNRSYRWTCCTA